MLINVKIKIEDDHIAVYHHGEEIVSWESNEWLNDNTLPLKIATAIHFANTDIMKLRKMEKKPLIVGDTDISTIKNGVVNYYVSIADKSSKRHGIGWSEDRRVTQSVFDETIKDAINIDVQLRQALIVETNNTFEVIDETVIASCKRN